MNLNPIYQTKIFGLKNYLNEIIDLYHNNNLPNKILLTGPKGTGKSTIAYHLINYIYSNQEDYSYNKNLNEINLENKSYKLVVNGSHPNFHLIDLQEDKKNIEISQIRKMITYTNKSNFNDLPKIILINNLEKLNINSINALLKITEEPNNNIYFIFIHNNNKKIANTIKSRCLTFKINLSFDETINITNKILDDDIYNLLNYDLINYYTTPGELINLINFSNENKIDLKNISLNEFLSLLINENYYKKNNFIGSIIFSYIELYFLKIINKSTNKKQINFYYSNFIHKINNTMKFNLDIDSLFMEFKSKILNG